MKELLELLIPSFERHSKPGSHSRTGLFKRTCLTSPRRERGKSRSISTEASKHVQRNQHQTRYHGILTLHLRASKLRRFQSSSPASLPHHRRNVSHTRRNTLVTERCVRLLNTPSLSLSLSLSPWGELHDIPKTLNKL